MIGLVLICLLVAVGMILPVSAAGSYVRGDADGDGTVTNMDATVIQRPEEQANKIDRLLAGGNKLDAVIELKAILGLELKEAKAAIDSYASSSSLPNTNNSNQKSGCYIATAINGSYNCPSVWVLRRYRDNSLSKNWYGRLFIRLYYAISPKLVDIFGNKEWFSKIWKPILDNKVRLLYNKGYSDKPYINP